MNNFLHRYGTPLTAGLFAVSVISGVALFFHWTPRMFHSMHEWLSMLLLAPFALHMLKNWRPLVAYARRRTLLVPLLLAVVAAVPFALTAGKGGRPRSQAAQTVQLMAAVPLAELAPVFQSTPEDLLQQLRRRGYRATSASQSPGAIAEASAVRASEVVYALMPVPRPRASGARR